MNRLLAIIIKELQQMRRDRMTLAMMIALPVMQILLFGYAIDTDVRNIPTVIYDQDHSAGSRDLVAGLEQTGFYDMIGNVRDYDEIADALRSSRARVALVIPSGYHADLLAQRRTTLQLVVDGSDPQIVASATQSAAGLVGARSAAVQASALGVEGGPLIQLEATNWYNPELRTAVFVVPGIVGVILTMTMVMLTAMAIARERERGTLEALIVSPVRSVELTLGKIIPYIGVGFVQVTLVLITGRIVFDVPFEGSIPLYYAMTFIFVAASLAVGLVFSTIAKTQQQAMQMSFFFLLPNILLSGFAFPWEGMPTPAQWLSEALPLTHYLRISRGIILKGTSLADVHNEVWWLCGTLVVLMGIATTRFTKKLG